MDPKSPNFQWTLLNSASNIFDNKDGCIQERLGSSLSENSNRRGMEFTGITTSYKCIGNEGSKTSFTSIPQAFSDESYSFPNRQYNSLFLSCEDGGTTNKHLIELEKEIWMYLLHYGITISAEYLQSSMNVEADWQSRNSKDHSEWKLLPQVFQRIYQIKGKPEMDLFASRLSAQLLWYMVWKRDLCSQGTDAMEQIWSNQYLYAFPPLLMIYKVLRKITQDQMKIMLIVVSTW